MEVLNLEKFRRIIPKEYKNVGVKLILYPRNASFVFNRAAVTEYKFHDEERVSLVLHDGKLYFFKHVSNNAFPLRFFTIKRKGAQFVNRRLSEFIIDTFKLPESKKHVFSIAKESTEIEGSNLYYELTIQQNNLQ